MTDSEKKAYEITQIRAHKRLPDGTLAYRVHWKGYRAKKYNSWVPEPDMSDCFELLNEYKQNNSLNPCILHTDSVVRVAPPVDAFLSFEDVPVPVASISSDEEIAISALETLKKTEKQKIQ